MKWNLYQVRVSAAGYEIGSGTYYGHGRQLWRAINDNGDQLEFRSFDRASAKDVVRRSDAAATFYR